MKYLLAITFILLLSYGEVSAQADEIWTTNDEYSYIVTNEGEKIYGEVKFLFDEMNFAYWDSHETRNLNMETYKELLAEARAAYSKFSGVESVEATKALNAVNELKYIPQMGVSFREGRREKEYLPGEIKGYMYDGEIWLSKSKREIVTKEDFFLRAQYAAGPIKLLFFIAKTNGASFPPVTTYTETMTMQKLEEDEVNPGLWMVLPGGFKRKMSKYVKDYPELAKKIKKKKQGYSMKIMALLRDTFAGSELPLYRIIKEYNQWYWENH